MDKRDKTLLTIRAQINQPVETVWELWNHDNHIVRWNAASPDWHTPSSKNDLRVGGKIWSRMEARDGSMGFDFEGTYTAIEPLQHIAYELGDGRRVETHFERKGDSTFITTQFEAESSNPEEMQIGGWQAILNSFKDYAEAYRGLKPLHFETLINATPEKVERVMLEKPTYEDWTTAFSPGSTFEGSWDEGARIHFVGPDGEGSVAGMAARIARRIPKQYVSIQHLGLVEKGVERLTGPDVEAWAPSFEEYRFVSRDGKTLLVIDVDTNAEYEEMFVGMWPNALARLKVLCE